MKRKVSLIGPSTLMVSLPSAWCKKYSVKKGDDMDVEEKDKNLIIGFNTSYVKTSKELDITPLGFLANRTVLGLYIAGADEIKLNFENPKMMEKIQKEIMGAMIGFEIIEQGKNHGVIKCVSEESESEFDGILRRIFILIQSAGNEIIESLEKKETDLGHIIFMDYSINRCCAFCLRFLNKRGFKENNKTSAVYSLIQGLENVGDMYKKLSKEVTEKKIIFNKEQLKIMRELNKQCLEVQHLFYKYDDKKALGVSNKYEELKIIIQKLPYTKTSFIMQELNGSIIKNILDNELTLR